MRRVPSVSGVFSSRRIMMRRLDSEAQLAQLAARMRWIKAVDLPADRRRGVPRRVAWQISLGLTVNYFRDDEFQMSYVALMSNLSQELADHFVALLETELDVLGEDEILRDAGRREQMNESVTAVVRAGMAAPESFDERYFAVLSEAASDDRPAVREAAVRGIFYTKWREFFGLLEDMSKSDRKRAVRKFAAEVLEAISGPGR
ncbi:hypothetical protein [Actinoplanes sp. NPDC049802]|uniref:hypothetical protein n=1 Tax=Actinoplanes sp. NPDC049802 TaxID=3154742 RepID=UPI0033E4494F